MQKQVDRRGGQRRPARRASRAALGVANRNSTRPARTASSSARRRRPTYRAVQGRDPLGRQRRIGDVVAAPARPAGDAPGPASGRSAATRRRSRPRRISPNSWYTSVLPPPVGSTAIDVAPVQDRLQGLPLAGQEPRRVRVVRPAAPRPGRARRPPVPPRSQGPHPRGRRHHGTARSGAGTPPVPDRVGGHTRVPQARSSPAGSPRRGAPCRGSAYPVSPGHEVQVPLAGRRRARVPAGRGRRAGPGSHRSS